MKKLRLILGDQLNSQHSWYQKVDVNILYCFFEMRQETDYVTHHIQKVVAFFMAMREFAVGLEEQGHTVIYFTLDDRRNTQSLTETCKCLLMSTRLRSLNINSQMNIGWMRC